MPEKIQKTDKFSSNPRIDNLLGNIVKQLAPFLEEQAQNINELTAIGRALSAQQDPAVTLEMILSQARRFTAADGGTLYLLDKDGHDLVFHVVHNDTLNIHMSGTSGSSITLPNVPLLCEDGNPNHANVSSSVANTGEVVNIPDVYEAKGFNFEGTKKFDASLKYRSKSMLVIPMRDHEDEIIGVLQLINAKDTGTKETIPFSSDTVEVAMALASQAAVVITQQRLIRELKELFESFIQAIATTIDEKSKYTGGHIERVAKLTMMIAEKVNETKEGPLRDVQFTQNEMDELRIAAWMHDTGKITTPEFVVDKANKLETVFDRIELIKTRWQAIRLARRLEAEKAKFPMVKEAADPEKLKEIDAACNRDMQKLNNDLDFLTDINQGGEFMAEDKLNRLDTIARGRYREDGSGHPLLNEDEVYNLSIPKGTLTEEERNIINNHALMTIKILDKLPWPKKLANVPHIAGAHHEKLDGSGHPLGLSGDQINVQSRIMAVADVFEALSAKDRPYKKPMPMSQAIKILNFMVKDNHVDKNLVDLFINSGLHIEYAKKFLDPSQLI
jgi:HD-GYP domain-containing protein (c-di-GMP phosphodiesterase class II)